MLPVFLVSTTMETYFHKGTPPAGALEQDKVPIYGENGHFGRTANSNFSWMLQIEASSVSEPNPPPLKTKSGVQPNAQR